MSVVLAHTGPRSPTASRALSSGSRTNVPELISTIASSNIFLSCQFKCTNMYSMTCIPRRPKRGVCEPKIDIVGQMTYLAHPIVIHHIVSHVNVYVAFDIVLALPARDFFASDSVFKAAFDVDTTQALSLDSTKNFQEQVRT